MIYDGLDYRRNIQLQAARASASYSLVLSMNLSLMMSPDAAAGALTEELEEDDDA